MTTTYRISEIFHSLQGEGPMAGLPTTFVRLVGCPLRCRWCDTEYAFRGGERMLVESVFSAIDSTDLPGICVTGGEPLASQQGYDLINLLADRYDTKHISVETSGAFTTSGLVRSVVRVVDWKAPSSGEGGTFIPDILDDLTKADALKFVIADDEVPWLQQCFTDYDLARHPATKFVHPIAGESDLASLAEKLVSTRLPVRFGMQLHKLIWPEVARGV